MKLKRINFKAHIKDRTGGNYFIMQPDDPAYQQLLNAVKRRVYIYGNCFVGATMRIRL